MASLVSAGVTTQLIDDSLFVPSTADTVPLFFVATKQGKKQSDGIKTALGTVQSNVVRTITSVKQSLDTFGVPSFLNASNGSALHGDARNEVGLFALNKFLGLGSLAYVVRANVNLDDEYSATSASWTTKTTGAAAELRALTAAYISAYNDQNGYVVGDVDYKETITGAELLTFTQQVMAPVFAESTFVNAEFDFYDSNLAPAANSAGYQSVNMGGGVTVGSLPTGLPNDATPFTATILVNGAARPISFTGAVAQTFTDLLIQLNADLGSTATATLDNGNIKITSSVTGSSSTVMINDTNVFTGLIGYAGLNLPVSGTTADRALDVWANGFNQPSTSTYAGFNGMIQLWATNPGAGASGHQMEWTASEAESVLLEAAQDFKFTTEFANSTSLGATDSAKRQAIVQALQAVVNSNSEIRSELYEYNLVICPGFPELVDDMLTLVEDIGDEAFVIGDVPYNLSPEDVANWAVAPAAAANSRRVNRNVAYYYPHAMSSNIDGSDVFVPASVLALRTYTYSDQQSEVWFAPAGPRRGNVTGVSRLGFVIGILGQPTTFVDVALNKGQRDSLYQYSANINPIANLPGRGMLVFGQKTSQSYASALDRVNVARLIAHIRRQARKLGFGFLFEPNDQITRNNFKSAIDNMLTGIMMDRGLVDFISICDATNNTPDRKDNHELYMDIAVRPEVSVEFIIIPITVKSQGASLTN